MDLSILKDLSVLYVEDDDAIRAGMMNFFRMLFDRIHSADNGKTGLDMFHHYKPQIVVTDIKMPAMNGLEMAAKIKEQSPDTPIIITTAFSEVDYLIEAIEIGIDRYVRKPIDQQFMIEALYKCGLPLIQAGRLKSLNLRLHKSLENQLGTATSMSNVINGIQQVAGTDFSVVLQGETGVGKSMAAELIHNLSIRAAGPFVTVDVGSIPENLVESELFGHKKGSFSGAVRDKKGLLETAQGGTLFMDELENIPLQVQGKLLRAVEERKMIPVGAVEPVDIDVRIICAVNVDFKRIVQENRFREDLYYRLNEFDIIIPPLRERREDIPVLANRFAAAADDELNKPHTHIAPDALAFLQSHSWPGNVRELKNLMRRAVLLSETNEITLATFKKMIEKTPVKSQVPEPDNQDKKNDLPARMLSLAIDDVEKWAIEEALARADGKRMKAAKILKIDYKRLVRKMEKYGITAD